MRWFLTLVLVCGSVAAAQDKIVRSSDESRALILGHLAQIECPGRLDTYWPDRENKVHSQDHLLAIFRGWTDDQNLRSTLQHELGTRDRSITVTELAPSSTEIRQDIKILGFARFFEVRSGSRVMQLSVANGGVRCSPSWGVNEAPAAVYDPVKAILEEQAAQ